MKFKNIKKKLPSNYRTITEGSKFSLPKFNSLKWIRLYGRFLKVFVVFIFIVSVIIVGLDLQKNITAKQNIDSQREVLIKNLSFWEDFISKHKDYRDAYFQASILEYKLGNSSKAKEYLEKGLSLDPNSENGKKLKKFLANK